MTYIIFLLPQQAIIFFIVVLNAASDQSSSCIVTTALGQHSDICYRGFGKTQYRPACTNGGLLVINSIALVYKPSCYKDRCCVRGNGDKWYNVSCLAAVTGDVKLVSLETGILRNCSRRENCSIELADRIDIPSIGSSARLLVSYSCENAKPADTISICFHQTLTTTRGYLQFLPADNLTLDKPTVCTCDLEGPDTNDWTVEALAVVLEDPGTLINLYGSKTQNVLWNTVLYGTNTTIFKERNFSVTLQTTTRAITTFLWLKLSGLTSFIVTCRGPAVTKGGEVEIKETCSDQAGNGEANERVWIIYILTITAVLPVCLIVPVWYCWRRRAKASKNPGNTEPSEEGLLLGTGQRSDRSQNLPDTTHTTVSGTKLRKRMQRHQRNKTIP